MDFDSQFDLVILIYLDFCALIPKERDKVLENIYRALKKDGVFICHVVNERNIDKKTISQSWEVQESEFWKNTPYIALTNGYHYPEEKVLTNHHVVIEEHDTVDTYIFWSHYYEKGDLHTLYFLNNILEYLKPINVFSNIIFEYLNHTNVFLLSFGLCLKCALL